MPPQPRRVRGSSSSPACAPRNTSSKSKRQQQRQSATGSSGSAGNEAITTVHVFIPQKLPQGCSPFSSELHDGTWAGGEAPTSTATAASNALLCIPQPPPFSLADKDGNANAESQHLSLYFHGKLATMASDNEGHRLSTSFSSPPVIAGGLPVPFFSGPPAQPTRGSMVVQSSVSTASGLHPSVRTGTVPRTSERQERALAQSFRSRSPAEHQSSPRRSSDEPQKRSVSIVRRRSSVSRSASTSLWRGSRRRSTRGSSVRVVSGPLLTAFYASVFAARMFAVVKRRRARITAETVEKPRAAFVIQCCWRRRTQRERIVRSLAVQFLVPWLRLKLARLHRTKETNALLLQRVFRGQLDRIARHAAHLEARLGAARNVMTNYVRRWVAQKQLTVLRQQRDERAIVLLQCQAASLRLLRAERMEWEEVTLQRMGALGQRTTVNRCEWEAMVSSHTGVSPAVLQAQEPGSCDAGEVATKESLAHTCATSLLATANGSTEFTRELFAVETAAYLDPSYEMWRRQRVGHAEPSAAAVEDDGKEQEAVDRSQVPSHCVSPYLSDSAVVSSPHDELRDPVYVAYIELLARTEAIERKVRERELLEEHERFLSPVRVFSQTLALGAHVPPVFAPLLLPLQDEAVVRRAVALLNREQEGRLRIVAEYDAVPLQCLNRPLLDSKAERRRKRLLLLAAEHPDPLLIPIPNVAHSSSEGSSSRPVSQRQHRQREGEAHRGRSLAGAFPEGSVEAPPERGRPQRQRRFKVSLHPRLGLSSSSPAERSVLPLSGDGALVHTPVQRDAADPESDTAPRAKAAPSLCSSSGALAAQRLPLAPVAKGGPIPLLRAVADPLITRSIGGRRAPSPHQPPRSTEELFSSRSGMDYVRVECEPSSANAYSVPRFPLLLARAATTTAAALPSGAEGYRLNVNPFLTLTKASDHASDANRGESISWGREIEDDAEAGAMRTGRGESSSFLVANSFTGPATSVASEGQEGRRSTLAPPPPARLRMEGSIADTPVTEGEDAAQWSPSSSNSSSSSSSVDVVAAPSGDEQVGPRNGSLLPSIRRPPPPPPRACYSATPTAAAAVRSATWSCSHEAAISSMASTTPVRFSAS